LRIYWKTLRTRFIAGDLLYLLSFTKPTVQAPAVLVMLATFNSKR